jgi:hypothetical protein
VFAAETRSHLFHAEALKTFVARLTRIHAELDEAVSFVQPQQPVDLTLTRCVSEGSLLKTRRFLSLTDVSGCDKPFIQQPAS